MFDIFVTVYIFFASIAIGIVVLKEYQSRQELLANKKRREEDNYSKWLLHTGLHETAYYFNTYGIRIFSGKRIF